MASNAPRQFKAAVSCSRPFLTRSSVKSYRLATQSLRYEKTRHDCDTVVPYFRDIVVVGDGEVRFVTVGEQRSPVLHMCTDEVLDQLWGGVIDGGEADASIVKEGCWLCSPAPIVGYFMGHCDDDRSGRAWEARRGEAGKSKSINLDDALQRFGIPCDVGEQKFLLKHPRGLGMRCRAVFRFLVLKFS